MENFRPAISSSVKAATVAAAAACVFFIGRYYSENGVGFDVADVAKFILFITVCFIPQGYLFIKAAAVRFPEGTEAPEKLAFALTAGYVASCFVCYLMSCAKAGWLYGWFSLGAFVFAARAAAMRGRRAGIGAGKFLALSWSRFRAPLAILALLACARFLYVYCYLTRGPDGEVFYRQFLTDNQFFVSIVHEFFRGVPLKEFPQLSGVAFPRYHFMGAFLAWMPSGYAGIDPIRSFHAYMPVFFTLLIVAHVFHACRRAGGGGDWWGCAGAALMLFLFAPVADVGFMKFRQPALSQLEYMYFSFSSLSALPLVAGFMNAFQLGEGRARGILCGLFAAAMCVYKINFFFVLFPAFIAYEGIMFAAGRARRGEAAAAAAFGLCVFAVGAAMLLRYSGGASIQLRFGLYASKLISDVTLPQGALYAAASRIPDSVLKYAFPSFAAFVAPFAQAGFVHSLLLCAFVFARPKERGAADFRLLALLVFLCVEFVYLFVVDTAMPLNVAVFLPSFIYVFATVPAVIGLKAARDGLTGAAGRLANGRAAKAAFGFALALSVACSAYSTFRPELSYKSKFDKDELAAMDYLRKNTPLDSVVFGGRSSKGLVSMFGGRRCVLCSDSAGPRFSYEFSRRVSDEGSFFNATDRAAAEKILRSYRVNYVVAYPESRLKFPPGGLMREVFRSGGCVVLRVY